MTILGFNDMTGRGRAVSRFPEWTLQDQRNHGQRTVDTGKRGNQGWSREPEEHNERHAQVSAGLS
jgi:hypothetical protein